MNRAFKLFSLIILTFGGVITGNAQANLLNARVPQEVGDLMINRLKPMMKRL